MTPVIDIAVEDDAWRVIDNLEDVIERAVTAALAIGRPAVDPGTELSVVLCDDAFIQRLNAQWRGKDKATNVLSFPAHVAPNAAMLGDIIVAFETCKREADEERRPLADHLSHLVVHGVFHLLGFDHENDHDAEAMESAESRALSALGIASPYESPAVAGLPA